MNSLFLYNRDMRRRLSAILILVCILLSASCRGKDSSHADVGFSPEEVYALGPVTLTADGAVYLFGSLYASCEAS